MLLGVDHAHLPLQLGTLDLDELGRVVQHHLLDHRMLERFETADVLAEATDGVLRLGIARLQVRQLQRVVLALKIIYFQIFFFLLIRV